MRFNPLFLILSAAFTMAIAQTPDAGKPSLPGSDLISQARLMETVEFLSSKELAGRLGGSEGFNKAATFMAKEFDKLNLKPIGGDKYFQYFNVEYNEISSPVRLVLMEKEKVKKEYQLGKDFVCRGFTGSGTVKAPVIFCGYGISKPEIGYDDYAGVDVKDKIVLAFKQNPQWKIKDADWGSGYPRSKASTARQHGALAILFASTPNDKNPQKTIISVLEGGGVQDEKFPELHIDIPAADEYLAPTGATLKELQTKIDSLKKPSSLNTGSVAEVEVHASYQKERRTMNVICLLEGSDPLLKNDYIVIGAHLDHVGSQAGEIYAPGANDNASGSAAVLELARAFVNGGAKPKRSLVFVLFACEENGLYGSSYFVNHPVVPLEKISAMINLDCIGYGDSIQVGNGKSSPKLWKIAKATDSVYTKMMVEATWNGGGADAGPFHEKGIPAAYFVTTNSYAHLHYMTDVAGTLNRPLFEKITKLAYLTAYRVARGEYTREEVLK